MTYSNVSPNIHTVLYNINISDIIEYKPKSFCMSCKKYNWMALLVSATVMIMYAQR